MNILTNLKPVMNSAAVLLVLGTLGLNYWKGLDAKKMGANLIVGCLIVALANFPEKLSSIGMTLFAWLGL